MPVSAPQQLPTTATDAGTMARQILRLIGPGRQAPDGSLAAADALAYGAAVDDSRQVLLGAAEEAFPSLADDLLSEWESLLGVAAGDTFTAAQRRSALVARTRALLGAAPQSIESAVVAYAGTCTVVEADASDVYAAAPSPTADTRRGVFRFALVVPDASVTNTTKLAAIKAIVSRMRPAHTAFNVVNGTAFYVDGLNDSRVGHTALGG